MDFSLPKSFKKTNSFSSSSLKHHHHHHPEEEKLPILQNHYQESSMTTVKINGDDSSTSDTEKKKNLLEGGGNHDNSTMWRESSYEFWSDNANTEAFNFRVGLDGRGGMPSKQMEGSEVGQGKGSNFRGGKEGPDDPPSKLIGEFLHKQKASGDYSLDMDLEMAELYDNNIVNNDTIGTTSGGNSNGRASNSLSPLAESPSGLQQRKFSYSKDNATRVSFKENENEKDESDVVKCSSNNASLQRRSSFIKARGNANKSRLLDPPPDQRKSTQMRSGLTGKAMEEDDDDPFSEEDLPEEYKKGRTNFLTWLQWISLVLIISALVCVVSIKKLRNKKLWELQLWKWEVFVLVLICGRLLSGWAIRIVVFFIERNFLLRKRVLYFVYGLRKAVQNCLWLGLVLVAWHFLFDKKVQKVVKDKDLTFLTYITKILVCLLVGTVLWLVKTLVIKVLASSFHVTTYFERIQESLFNQYVIETLSGPPLIEMQKAEEEEQRIVVEVQKLQNAGAMVPPDLRATAFPPPKSPGRVIGSGGIDKSPKVKSTVLSGNVSKKQEEGITIDHLHKLNQKNVSAWNMKRLMNIVRHGFLSTLDEQISDSTHEDESAMQIKSEVEAKAAARKIFQNVARQGCKFICLEDLQRFLPDDEALKALSFFEGATESNRIGKSSLKNWVVNAFRERRALALTLNDTKTAVNRLHKVANIVVGIIILIISLIILGIASSKFLVLVSSQLLLAAFIFGNTLKTIFEAIIFLFVIHPFDVGDRCEIEGVQMVVEEMNILTTVFLRYDNQKVMYPNSILATKPIHNYNRSPDMGDGIEFFVHIATPPEKIAVMKQRIIGYIENKKDHWYPAPMIVLKDMDGLNGLKFALWLTHRMNHQDMGEKWTRRSHLLEEMVKIFRELDIQYRLYPININVRAMPAPNSTGVPPDWAAAPAS